MMGSQPVATTPTSSIAVSMRPNKDYLIICEAIAFDGVEKSQNPSFPTITEIQ